MIPLDLKVVLRPQPAPLVDPFDLASAGGLPFEGALPRILQVLGRGVSGGGGREALDERKAFLLGRYAIFGFLLLPQLLPHVAERGLLAIFGLQRRPLSFALALPVDHRQQVLVFLVDDSREVVGKVGASGVTPSVHDRTRVFPFTLSLSFGNLEPRLVCF